MKLAKVNHQRCDDPYRATTYVWVADDMSATQFQVFVDAARDEYLQLVDAFAKEPAAKHPGYRFDIEKFDSSKSVAEAQAEFKRMQQEHHDWEQRKAATKSTFGSFLSKHSNGAIVGFYNFDPAIKAEVKWGHRHGTEIDYTNVTPTENDFNANKDDDWL